MYIILSKSVVWVFPAPFPSRWSLVSNFFCTILQPNSAVEHNTMLPPQCVPFFIVPAVTFPTLIIYTVIIILANSLWIGNFYYKKAMIKVICIQNILKVLTYYQNVSFTIENFNGWKVILIYCEVASSNVAR